MNTGMFCFGLFLQMISSVLQHSCMRFYYANEDTAKTYWYLLSTCCTWSIVSFCKNKENHLSDNGQ